MQYIMYIDSIYNSNIIFPLVNPLLPPKYTFYLCSYCFISWLVPYRVYCIVASTYSWSRFSIVNCQPMVNNNYLSNITSGQESNSDL